MGIPHRKGWEEWDMAATKPLASFRIQNAAMSLERTGLSGMVWWSWVPRED